MKEKRFCQTLSVSQALALTRLGLQYPLELCSWTYVAKLYLTDVYLLSEAYSSDLLYGRSDGQVVSSTNFLHPTDHPTDVRDGEGCTTEQNDEEHHL